jgi:hypothetical protein
MYPRLFVFVSKVINKAGSDRNQKWRTALNFPCNGFSIIIPIKSLFSLQNSVSDSAPTQESSIVAVSQNAMVTPSHSSQNYRKN